MAEREESPDTFTKTKPHSKTKKRLLSESSDTGDSSSTEGSKGYYPVDRWPRQKTKMVTLTNEYALGMYKIEDKGRSKTACFPHHVMLGGPKSKVVYIVRIGGKIKIETLELNQTQKKKYDCFVECATKMFGGLKYDPASRVWLDHIRPKKRYNACKSIVRNHGYGDGHGMLWLPYYLSTLHEAFTHGFYNSVSRNAMHDLCDICRLLLMLPVEFKCVNIGSSSSHVHGCCKVAYFYANWTESRQKEENFKIFDVEAIESKHCHTHVPDFLIRKWKNLNITVDRPVLLGECKSSDSDNMLAQLWHQILGVLFHTDAAYGCGATAQKLVLMQLNKRSAGDRGLISTKVQEFDFVKDAPNENVTFNTEEFCNAVCWILQILRESLDENDFESDSGDNSDIELETEEAEDKAEHKSKAARKKEKGERKDEDRM